MGDGLQSCHRLPYGCIGIIMGTICPPMSADGAFCSQKDLFLMQNVLIYSIFSLLLLGATSEQII